MGGAPAAVSGGRHLVGSGGDGRFDKILSKVGLGWRWPVMVNLVAGAAEDGAGGWCGISRGKMVRAHWLDEWRAWWVVPETKKKEKDVFASWVSRRKKRCPSLFRYWAVR